MYIWSNPTFTGTVVAPTLNSTTLSVSNANVTNLTVSGLTSITEIVEQLNKNLYNNLLEQFKAQKKAIQQKPSDIT